MTVIPLTPRERKPDPADLLWVCACGCSSFELWGNGLIRCCACEGLVAPAEHAGWYDTVTTAPVLPKDHPPPIQTIVAHGGDLAEARARKRASESDWIICGKFDGQVTSWSCDVLTLAQYEWLQRRVQDGLAMLAADVVEEDPQEVGYAVANDPGAPQQLVD